MECSAAVESKLYQQNIAAIITNIVFRVAMEFTVPDAHRQAKNSLQK